jgi:hypothetical protein
MRLKISSVPPTLSSSYAMVPNRKTVRSLDSLTLAGTRDDWNRGFNRFSPSQLLARPLTSLYIHVCGCVENVLQHIVWDPVYDGMPGLCASCSADPTPSKHFPSTIFHRLPYCMRGKGKHTRAVRGVDLSRLGGKLCSVSKRKAVKRGS